MPATPKIDAHPPRQAPPTYAGFPGYLLLVPLLRCSLWPMSHHRRAASRQVSSDVWLRAHFAELESPTPTWPPPGEIDGDQTEWLPWLPPLGFPRDLDPSPTCPEEKPTS